MHTLAFDVDDNSDASISQKVESGFRHKALEQQQIRTLLQNALNSQP